jgi:GTP-binding protein EngB required for normal cell division
VIETQLILTVLVVDLPGIGMTKFNKDYQNIQNADVEKLIAYKNTIKLQPS